MTCCWVSLLLFFSLCSKVLSSTPLISFKVPIAPKSLLWNYWINETFYAEFLSSGLHNQKITVSPWLKVNPFNSRAISRSLQREVRSFHPLHKDHSYLRLLGGTIPPFAEVSTNSFTVPLIRLGIRVFVNKLLKSFQDRKAASNCLNKHISEDCPSLIRWWWKLSGLSRLVKVIVNLQKFQYLSNQYFADLPFSTRSYLPTRVGS